MGVRVSTCVSALHTHWDASPACDEGCHLEGLFRTVTGPRGQVGCRLPAAPTPTWGRPASLLLLLDGLQLVFQLLLADSLHEEEVQADEGFPQRRVHPAAHSPVRRMGDSVGKERHVLGQLHGLLLIALRKGDSLCHMGRAGDASKPSFTCGGSAKVLWLLFCKQRDLSSALSRQWGTGRDPQGTAHPSCKRMNLSETDHGSQGQTHDHLEPHPEH